MEEKNGLYYFFLVHCFEINSYMTNSDIRKIKNLFGLFGVVGVENGYIKLLPNSKETTFYFPLENEA